MSPACSPDTTAPAKPKLMIRSGLAMDISARVAAEAFFHPHPRSDQAYFLGAEDKTVRIESVQFFPEVGTCALEKRPDLLRHGGNQADDSFLHLTPVCYNSCICMQFSRGNA